MILFICLLHRGKGWVKFIGRPFILESGVVDVAAICIRPFSSNNDVTLHFLSVIYAHERNKKKDLVAKKKEGDFVVLPSISLKERIVSIIGAFDNKDEGLYVNNIIAELPFYDSAEDVFDTINELVTDGILYTTIDKYHFKLT